MNRQLKGSIILLLAAIIWGTGFVAQDKGADFVGPFTINAVRWIIGALFLTIIVVLKGKSEENKESLFVGFFNKSELIGGSVCGVLLFVSSSFQQFGISLYSDSEAAAGEAGFITALYIVLVPLCGLFMKKRVPVSVWVAIGIALLGMYLLCIKSEFSISSADILVFLCAVAFTFHILTIDRFSESANGLRLSAVQMLVCGILSVICMFAFEQPQMSGILKAAVPLLYLGILPSGVAYTFQIIGQKNTNPALASVIMSLESIFAALTGTLFGERMSSRETLGSVLMFVAVLLAQVDITEIVKKVKRNKSKI